MKYFGLLLLLCLACSLACSSGSPDDYRERGSAILRALVKELKKVHTREELMDREAKIHHLFAEMSLLVHEADTYLQVHPGIEVPLFSRADQDLSDELQIELNRLLRKEGCREILHQFLIEK